MPWVHGREVPLLDPCAQIADQLVAIRVPLEFGTQSFDAGHDGVAGRLDRGEYGAAVRLQLVAQRPVRGSYGTLSHRVLVLGAVVAAFRPLDVGENGGGCLVRVEVGLGDEVILTARGLHPLDGPSQTPINRLRWDLLVLGPSLDALLNGVSQLPLRGVAVPRRLAGLDQLLGGGHTHRPQRSGQGADRYRGQRHHQI